MQCPCVGYLLEDTLKVTKLLRSFYQAFKIILVSSNFYFKRGKKINCLFQPRKVKFKSSYVSLSDWLFEPGLANRLFVKYLGSFFWSQKDDFYWRESFTVNPVFYFICINIIVDTELPAKFKLTRALTRRSWTQSIIEYNLFPKYSHLQLRFT